MRPTPKTKKKLKDYNISWNINRKPTTRENPCTGNSTSIVEEVLIG